MMNQITNTISLRTFMEGEDGWGHEEGKMVGDRLRSHIETKPEVSVFHVSLLGVRRTDASFPRESVVEIAKQYRKSKIFCLVDVPGDDILDNWEAAAQKKEQPLVIWGAMGWRLIGPTLTDSLQKLFDFVISRESATTSEIATELRLNISNASNQLKKLWEGGYLLRRECVATTGGIEFEYFGPR